MPVRLKVESGKLAIYTGGDNDPFTDPLDHVSRLLFHSDLAHIAVLSTHTGTLSLPSRSHSGPSATLLATHTLFAHGRPSTPYVEGKITSGLSQVVTLAGSVPVQVWSSGFGARWLSLGATATHVVIHEQASLGLTGVNFASLSLGWTVYLTDLLL